MRLWAVPATMVERAWPLAEEFIESACARPDAGPRTVAMIRDLCPRSDWQLWIGFDGDRPVAAGATQFQQPEPYGPKRIVLVACGGKGLRELIGVARQIERYGRFNGARRSRIEGRKGWARVLGYEVIGRSESGGFVMERPL